MKLGLAIDYSQPQISIPYEKIALAERLGYDSVWSAEAYGSDALTPLGFIGSRTQHLRLGTGLIQLAARTPVATAMAAATLDQLSGGNRVIIGLGVSGPQIVEGWYGRPWGKPVDQLRDYVSIMRKVFKREGPVTHKGNAISLPYAGEGSIGQGKPLKCILHPNPDIPIWLGCGGPASTRLMAELCDGWLPMGLTPENWESTYRPLVEEGLAKANASRVRANEDGSPESEVTQTEASGSKTATKTLADLEIQGGCHVEVTDDVEAAWARRKPAIGFLVGGYGSRTHNFHKETMIRRGYGEAAEKVQELFLGGKRDEAFASIPDAYIDEMGLYGTEERIRQRFGRFHGGPFTGLTVHTDDLEIVEMMADVAGLTPRD